MTENSQAGAKSTPLSAGQCSWCPTASHWFWVECSGGLTDHCSSYRILYPDPRLLSPYVSFLFFCLTLPSLWLLLGAWLRMLAPFTETAPQRKLWHWEAQTCVSSSVQVHVCVCVCLLYYSSYSKSLQDPSLRKSASMAPLSSEPDSSSRSPATQGPCNQAYQQTFLGKKD